MRQARRRKINGESSKFPIAFTSGAPVELTFKPKPKKGNSVSPNLAPRQCGARAFPPHQNPRTRVETTQKKPNVKKGDQTRLRSGPPGTQLPGNSPQFLALFPRNRNNHLCDSAAIKIARPSRVATTHLSANSAIAVLRKAASPLDSNIAC